MRKHSEISPDEIFLDSANLPSFDTAQFEGRLERPIGKGPYLALLSVFVLAALVFGGRLLQIQFFEGKAYAERSIGNTLETTPLFAARGEIFDRRKEKLAWNEPVSGQEFLGRRYTNLDGSAHLLGFLKYPTKDASGFFIRKDFEGVAGAEKELDEILAGENGVKTSEFNVYGEVVSESEVRGPKRGADVILSVDARLSNALYVFLSERIKESKFQGGAAAIMDVVNGEIIALTSAPEYDSQIMSDGRDAKAISDFVKDQHTPFLDRASAGLYAPGSIVKPLVAAAALQEKVIDPKTKILSTGSISIPNPYLPGSFSVFKDWKAHGLVDMRRALAVSSDVYFYEIGGGFENQRGLGINLINKYLDIFGLGRQLADPILGQASGVIPNPEWKSKMFNGEQWRIGDTYNTSIGQYGTLVTPLQMVRTISAVANGGELIEPTVILDDAKSSEKIPIAAENLAITREGMREAVTEGTASGLLLPYVSIAAKTGTAEVGISKKKVNSWIVGFFPYESPRYAFVVMLERGPYENTIGGVFVMRQFFEWLAVNAPEYLE